MSITVTTDNNVIQWHKFQVTSVPVLSDFVVNFSTPNGNCWFVPLLHPVSDVTYHIVRLQDAESFL